MYEQYTTVPREQVEAACPTPKKTRPDCRGEAFHNSNISGRLYGVTTGRYDSLAVRSESANKARKEREEAWVERSFKGSHSSLSQGPERIKGSNGPTKGRYAAQIAAEDNRRKNNRNSTEGA